MRIAMVYFKDPIRTLDGMDTIRWLELSRGLADRGHYVEMVTRDGNDERLSDRLVVRHISNAKWDTYDIVKTTNHFDIFAVPEHPFLVCRVGRVVDTVLPERVFRQREQLIEAQDWIARRAKFVTLMSDENVERWHQAYPAGPAPILVPNGCPKIIREVGPSPYQDNHKRVLYLGSLTSSRFVHQLNRLGNALKRTGIELHHVGRSHLDIYGETDERLDPTLVSSHGAVSEEKSWDYLFHADVGLMFARGRHVFDNEISKVYYYLRAGVPTISEEFVSTNSVITETGWGEIAPYDDIDTMTAAIIRWVDAPRDRRGEIGEQVASRHSWDQRVAIYHQLFQHAQS